MTDLTSVDATLESRGNVYGEFANGARIMQDLKFVMQRTPGWSGLFPDEQEALDMIASKIGRILNGASGQVDSWHDIAGYARLIEKRIRRQLRKKAVWP